MPADDRSTTHKAPKRRWQRDSAGLEGDTGGGTAVLPPYSPRHAPRRAQASHPAPIFPNPDSDPPPFRPAGAIALPVPVLKSLPDAVCDPRTLPNSPLELPRKLGKLDHNFFEVDLPRLNAEASRGALTADAFAAFIGERLTRAELDGLIRVGSRMDEDRKVWTLAALGIVASSIVRHARTQSGRPDSSEGLGLIAGLEQALLAFGRLTGRPPRDTAELIWARDYPFSWTGSDGERRFGDAVREAERLLGGAARLLDELRAGKIKLAEAAELLEEAAALVSDYVAVQADLARNPFAEAFLAMRDYLGAIRIGGIDWAGPNATNLPGWTNLDLAVGLLGGKFDDIARARTRYMSREASAVIERSVALPTLCCLVGRTLGTTAEGLQAMDPAELRSQVLARPVPLRRAIFAAGRLAKAVASLSAVHFSAIRKNLVEPVERMSAEEKARRGVDPDKGVSTAPLAATLGLRDERMRHPLARMTVQKEEG